MKVQDAIATGIRHIQENRLRAGLSILGIFIGIASVLCMMAIGDGAKQIIAAHGMAHVAVRILPIVEKWPVVLSGHWILISVIFSVLMGISFGVYPAIRAARLSPIDALRTEN